jgi:hypothetical protein
MNGYRDRITSGLRGMMGHICAWLTGRLMPVAEGIPCCCPCGDRCGLQHLLRLKLGDIRIISSIRWVWKKIKRRTGQHQGFPILISRTAISEEQRGGISTQEGEIVEFSL